ncbi:hypothetical protein [Streptomyces coelicoflavus]|uniref:hypothetical protein n=1 Tax=Streptomyces coelicoflavus TaxID=285562 RepID=UPI003A8BE8D6
MKVDIAWWDLTGSAQTIDSMRTHLKDDDGVAEWSGVAGLFMKFWVADAARNRWGAVMVWETDRPAPEELPPNRAAELIGGPPTHRTRFDVEATAEGVHALCAPGTRFAP